MEENKYYTPEIEEFHVGFEYEITNGYEWVKKSFCHEDFNTFLYQHLYNAINQQHVRVKFLDREDIESLGWEFKERCIWEIPFIYSFDEIGIGEVNNVKGAWRLIYTKDRFCAIIKDCYGDSDHFRGEVKNKSELRKLMKMLEITK